jgi:selenocysteine lyase/cysteine desulfurase
MKKPTPEKFEIMDAFTELEQGVYAALETYANVHRGSGHFSMASTHIYEQARDVVLDYLGLRKAGHLVIFCTPRRAEVFMKQLRQGDYQLVSIPDEGILLGIRALVVKKRALHGGEPFQSGGGTTKLVAKEWVIWADGADRFEAGTPAIINVAAFARALSLVRSGKNPFAGLTAGELTASDILYHDELRDYSGKELMEKLRLTLIGRSVQVPTAEGVRPFVNLDNGASTPTFTPIWDACRQTWRQPEPVRQIIVEEVKKICAEFLNAPPSAYEVIFTSNTTEAINLAAESLNIECDSGTGAVVINTILEHSSNELPWREISGCELIRLTVNEEGFLDLNELQTMLDSKDLQDREGTEKIRLVAVSGASNVLGVCNNLQDISRIIHQHGARLLVDAAQLVAHRAVDMEACGIDYLAFSAHKIYAPFGSGALVVRKGLLKFNAADRELIRSSGEENAGGIAALGKALVLLNRIGMDLIREEEQVLTARVLRGLATIPEIKIYGIKNPESPEYEHKAGVIPFGFKDALPIRVARQLALEGGIGVRAGCLCAHLIIKHMLHISPSLEQFQRLIQHLLPKFRFLGVIRVSLGIENTGEDIDALIRTMEKIASRTRTKTCNNAACTKPTIPVAQVQQQMDDFIHAAALRVYDLSESRT